MKKWSRVQATKLSSSNFMKIKTPSLVASRYFAKLLIYLSVCSLLNSEIVTSKISHKSQGIN